MTSSLLHLDGETQRDLIAQAHQIAALLGPSSPPGPSSPSSPPSPSSLDGKSRGRVVLSCRHADAFVPGLLGAWLAGATVELLPNVAAGTLDRVDADPELAHVLHDDPARKARSSKAIYVPALLTAAAKAVAVPAVLTAPATAQSIPALPAVPAMALSVPAGLAAPATALSVPAQLATPAGSTSAATISVSTIAVRMTTSGTTERPRYVEKTAAQLLGELEVLVRMFPRARCVMSTVPLSHLYGLLFGALLPLRFGARIVSHEALLPADVAAVIEREGVDLLISTPAHLRAMAEAPMPRGLRVISSGARMPGELHLGLAAAHGWHVTDILGSTETGGIATRTHPMHAWTPLPGVTVSAPDQQLVVESPWGGAPRAEIGDRIELRADGTFHYLGRDQELIKIAGKRAATHELEATICAVPGITDVAVLVHAMAGKEPRIAAAICVAEGSSAGRDEVELAVRRQFDAVFVPKLLKIVPRIPRTERGKLDGEALRTLLGITATPTTTQIPARRVGPGEYVAEIPRDLVFFQGHFEAFPILPGAVLVERLVWPIVRAELPEVRQLRAIRRLRFRRPVMPEQQLSVTLQQTGTRLSFEVTCAQAVVASGQLVVA